MIDDQQFDQLLETTEPEVLHAFAMAVYDAAWSDGSGELPQFVLGNSLARFVAQVALEHSARHAERQARKAPT